MPNCGMCGRSYKTGTDKGHKGICGPCWRDYHAKPHRQRKPSLSTQAKRVLKRLDIID